MFKTTLKSFVFCCMLAIPLAFAGMTEAESISPADYLKMGERIYNAQGANTCLMCHGVGGKGGSIAEAPRLDEPRTWTLYKALGGDLAFKNNPKKFLQHLEMANTQLILLGAIRFNQEFAPMYPEIHFDWSKTAARGGKLNPLMYGIRQAPTLKIIEEMRQEILQQKKGPLSRDEMPAVAARAVYQYLKTLDQGGKNGGVFVKNKH